MPERNEKKKIFFEDVGTNGFDGQTGTGAGDGTKTRHTSTLIRYFLPFLLLVRPFPDALLSLKI